MVACLPRPRHARRIARRDLVHARAREHAELHRRRPGPRSFSTRASSAKASSSCLSRSSVLAIRRCTASFSPCMRAARLSTASSSRAIRSAAPGSARRSVSSRFCKTARRRSYDLSPPGSYDLASLRSSSSRVWSAATRNACRALCSEMVSDTRSAAALPGYGLRIGGGGGERSPDAPSSKQRPPTSAKLSSNGTERLACGESCSFSTTPLKRPHRSSSSSSPPGPPPPVG